MLKLNYDNVDSPLKPWGFFSTTDCYAQPSSTWGFRVQRLKHPMEVQVLSSSEQWSPAPGILHDFLSLSPITKPKSRIFTLSDSKPYGIVCARELLPKSSGTLETRKRSSFGLEFSFSLEGSPSCLRQGSNRVREILAAEREARSWWNWRCWSAPALWWDASISGARGQRVLCVWAKREADLNLNLKTHAYSHLNVSESKYILYPLLASSSCHCLYAGMELVDWLRGDS